MKIRVYLRVGILINNINDALLSYSSSLSLGKLGILSIVEGLPPSSFSWENIL